MSHWPSCLLALGGLERRRRSDQTATEWYAAILVRSYSLLGVLLPLVAYPTPVPIVLSSHSQQGRLRRLSRTCSRSSFRLSSFAFRSQGNVSSSCLVGGRDTKRPIAQRALRAGVGPTEGRVLDGRQNRR